MSDSDEDLMAESVARLQHHTFNRRAPNMNNTNITSFSFGNNMMTSTFRSNYERQRNGMQHSNQRNMFNRRETSPMSLNSFPDSRMQNFRNYANGMSSCNRSVFNGRSGSPMSVRSIDSNVSVSASDIAFAFKNVKFNKNDLRLIKDAYNKFMKNRARKRIEKRRNLKLFLKGYRRKSGEDSGEQGSDSSISSDDCRSTRTFYKDNRTRSGPKSTITDINQFRCTIKESDMYRDCSERFKQTKLRNMLAINNTNVNHAVNDTSNHQNHKKSQENLQQGRSTATLKDRFTKNTNSYLLPSQRFNNSTTNPKIQENTVNSKQDFLRTNNNIVEQNKSLDSDSEEIFSEITIRENTQIQQKRGLEDSEINSSDRKRYKSAPQTNLNNLNNVTNSDFYFKIPQMPVRKSGNNSKTSAPEQIIAMSKQLIGNINLDKPNKVPKNIDDTQKPVNSTEIEESTNQTETTQNTTDVSMRPSFIKRKLFTQKLDVVEKDNLSSDSNGASSPQTNMYSDCRERNKVRKLVTSQSCLSRDIMGDDNVLDLIHKIVPPDKMNMTTASNKKEVNKSSDNDKWDVTSVISTCNIGDVSDTFTDEEIFKAPSKLNNKTKKHEEVNESVAVNTNLPKPVEKPKNQCKVVVKKLSPVPNAKQTQNLNLQKNGDGGNKSELPNKRTISSCIKSFWDTDFESDMEDRTGTPWKPKIQLNSGKGVQKNVAGDNSKMNFSKKSATKGTILTIRSLQNKTVNSSMRSDISRASKRNIESQENKENYNTPKKNNKNLKNNDTPKNNNKNKNNKNLKNNKKEDMQPKEKNLKNTKSKQKDETIKIANEKPNSKPAQSKTKNTVTQNSKKESPCNTSRESLRLKEKNEKKVNNNNTLNSVVKSSRCRSRTSEQNQDSIKPNLNKNSKEIKNKKNDKPVKKNATINHPKAQTPQRKQNTRLFTTPISDSSFNISYRSLRIRHR